jgi:hypothetical protein
MKQDQVNGILRAGLAALGGILGGTGYSNESDWAQISGAITVIVAAVWSLIEKRKIQLPPASRGVGLIMLGCLLMCSGCASMIAVSTHDGNVKTQAKVLQAQVLGNGGVGVGVDLLSLNTGYFSAWKDQPAMMAGATGLDLITTLGAAYMISQQSSGGGDSGGGVSITGDGNQVTTGDGSPATKTKTTTSGVE